MRKKSIFIVITLLAIYLNSFSIEDPKIPEFNISLTSETSFFDYYENLFEESDRILLTSDLLFYSEHLILDYSLRLAEEEFLYCKTDTLLSILIEDLKVEMKNSKNKNLNVSFLTALSYLSVSKKLLASDWILPEEAKKKAEAEIKCIENHAGFQKSEIFGREEDFSQYIPRGHYTKSEKLKQYFKSLMYLQRMRFCVKLKGDDPYTELKASLIIGDKLNKNISAKRIFKEINDVISILLPMSDDLRIDEFIDYSGFKLTELCNEDRIKELAKYAEEKSKSKIISDLVKDNEDKPVFIGLMGQRYIFDSEVFQNLVYDNVKSYTGKISKPFTYGEGVRTFPRGLDLMYVLGSTKSYMIMDDEGDVSYEGYAEHSKKMRAAAGNLDNKTFYNMMLNQYKTVINKRNEDIPRFMSDEKYILKELNTLLASWASLRHDNILYAKQSYTVKVTSAAPRDEKGLKFVIAEKYEGLYEQMKSDVDYLLNNLQAKTKTAEFGLAGASFGSLADIYLDVCADMDKQKDYTDAQKVKNAVWGLNNRIKSLLKNSKEKDDNVLIVADVHTDSNSETVLEEAVGPISEIKARFKNNEFTGGGFSYFEFKEKMSGRLTDEEWQERVKSENIKNLRFDWQNKLYD